MSRIKGIDLVQVQKDAFKARKNDENKHRLANRPNQSTEKEMITDLVTRLPQLDQIMEVHRKIGEGTFSTVYLGSLRAQAAQPEHERRWFAIKHLVPTAHPARVEHELRCLREMGGKDNVIGVDLCLRHLDTVVFVMPYIPHRKFSEFVRDMTVSELREYLRALLQALSRVHSFGVIHRDVKPSNFLYDRENRRYMLVDFGLAQRITTGPEGDTRVSVRRPTATPPPPPVAPCSPATPPPAVPRPLKRTREDNEAQPSGGVKRALVSGVARCACSGRGAVCAVCVSRPAPRAPRAGTCGFRPPEVLLKCTSQGTAVDLWAAGVVALSALAGRHPLLRAPDDVAALAELGSLLGTARLQRAAEELGRRVVVGAPRRGVPLRALVSRARGGAAPFPPSAYALVGALLEPSPARRLTARAALQHPFFTEEP